MGLESTLTGPAREAMQATVEAVGRQMQAMQETIRTGALLVIEASPDTIPEELQRWAIGAVLQLLNSEADMKSKVARVKEHLPDDILREMRQKGL